MGDTVFELHDEGDGCLAVETLHPGLQRTVERLCFHGELVVGSTDECGWLAEGPDTESEFGCDIELPVALYGQVTESHIAHVCVGTIETVGSRDQVTGARFLDVDAERFILEPALPGEGPWGHLFNAEGLRYGEPPLDAPSDPIYRLCEEQAPWGETTPLGYGVDLWVGLAEELRRDEVTVVLEIETGTFRLSGSVAEDGGPGVLPVRVAASSTGIIIGVETGDGSVLSER